MAGKSKKSINFPKARKKVQKRLEKAKAAKPNSKKHDILDDIFTEFSAFEVKKIPIVR